MAFGARNGRFGMFLEKNGLDPLGIKQKHEILGGISPTLLLISFFLQTLTFWAFALLATDNFRPKQ